jgi:GNAT superfamily N-acetyltransferase
MDITIKTISAQQTHEVRHAVLRKGMAREHCIFSGDELATTFHLGIFYEGEIVGVATFLLKVKTEVCNAHPDAKIMYQLRGMAIMEKHQGKGLGHKLIECSEEKLREYDADLLWFHARTSAVKFYQKMGCIVLGEEIQLEPAGPHFKMYKLL